MLMYKFYIMTPSLIKYLNLIFSSQSSDIKMGVVLYLGVFVQVYLGRGAHFRSNLKSTAKQNCCWNEK